MKQQLTDDNISSMLSQTENRETTREKDEQIETLQQNYQNLEKEKKQSEEALKEEISELKDEIAAKKRTLEEKNQKNTSYGKKINQLQAEREDLKTEQAELKKEFEKLATEYKEREKEVKELKEVIKRERENLEETQNKLELEKVTREAFEKYQKELNDNLIEKALIAERVKVREEKIKELREKLQTLEKDKKRAVEKQLQTLREELISFGELRQENQKSEKGLQNKVELLRRGPTIMGSEIETKIDEVKKSLEKRGKKETKEWKWLNNISIYHKNLLKLRDSEEDFISLKKKLGKLKTELLTAKNISSIEVGEVRKIMEKSDKLIELYGMLRKVNKIEDKEQKTKEELSRKELELKLYDLEQASNIEFNQDGRRDYGLCPKCQRSNTGINWCQVCKSQYFQVEFENWTSGNLEIDELIRKYQSQAVNEHGILEWISHEKLEVEKDESGNNKVLAEGGFGKIYKARWNKREVVLKSLNNSQNITADFLQEITAHKLFSDKIHVVPCYGISQDPKTKNYLIVMEYIKDGNLRQYLKNNYRQLTFENKLFLLLNIIRGLKSIHEQELVHQDFHLGNILNNSSKNGNLCYITDLGLCRPANKEDKGEEIFGVLSYMAPEVLQKKPYTQAADIYSFGMISYEVLTGLIPYYGSTDTDSILLICQGEKPQFQIKIPQLLEDLIKQCWDVDPKKRPNASELEKNLLLWWSEIKDKNSTSFTQQTQEAEEYNKTLPNEVKFPNYGLNLTSKSINTKQVTNLLKTAQFGGAENLELDLDLVEEQLENVEIQENSQEEQLQTHQEIPPK